MAVDLNQMGATIKDILSGVAGINSTFDYEPQNIEQLPAATLYFDSFSQTEATTNSAYVDWKWMIRIYIDLNTSDLQGTQLKLRDLITNTLKQLRANIDLKGTCRFHTVSSGDVYNIVDRNRPMMVAELTLDATTLESFY